MKITIIGAGYVGLVTGLSLAKLGHKVVCVESNIDKVSTINKGESPFFEQGIDQLLKELIKKDLFQTQVELVENVSNSDITIIAVGTPTIDNKIDLSTIKKASEEVGKALQKTKKYHVVAVKSTVLPGVTEEVVKPLLEKYSHKKVGEFGLCMNPEFLREGNALEDALHPDRIVIGQADVKSGQEFAKIYQKVSAPKIFTNLATAEMTKYAANALFATLISFSNEIARISESIDKVDVQDVWKGVHLDKRLSPLVGNIRIKPGVLSYIMSGCGYGGSCFPKDVKAFATFSSELGIDSSLLKSVIDINTTQPKRIILLLKSALGDNLKNKRIAVLGLSFKPNTDDTRESPALPIINELISEGAKIICHDPMASIKVIPQVSAVEEAVKEADAVVIITAWEDYLKLSPKFFKKNMKTPIVIDSRRIYDKLAFQDAGIIYKGVGL